MGWATGVEFLAGAEKGFSSLSNHIHIGSGVHPASYPMDNRDLFTRVKWLEPEADHSPPSTTEVKNMWRYISTPPYVFIMWCVISHRNSFTCTQPMSPCIQLPHYNNGANRSMLPAQGLVTFVLYSLLDFLCSLSVFCNTSV
jgi:hypothetical protein